MCTDAEGREINRIFLKYRNGKVAIDLNDKKILDDLVVAGYIDYVYKGKNVYAEASDIGRDIGRAWF
jgi:hypothetical protein